MRGWRARVLYEEKLQTYKQQQMFVVKFLEDVEQHLNFLATMIKDTKNHDEERMAEEEKRQEMNRY